MAIIDGGHTKAEMKNNQTVMKAHEEEMEELDTVMAEIEEAYDGIHDELEGVLEEKEKRQRKLKKIIHHKVEMEKKIRTATREFEKLVKEKEKEDAKRNGGSSQQRSEAGNVSSNGSVGSMMEERMVIEKFNEEAPEEWNKKHTGSFEFNKATELFCWSCCLHEDYKGPGCIDDQSVGVIDGMTERPSHIMRPHTNSDIRSQPIMWMRTAQPPSPFAAPPIWPVPKHKVTKEHHSMKIRPPRGWDGTHPPKPKPRNIETLTPNRLHMKSRGSLSSRNGGMLSPSGGLVNDHNNSLTSMWSSNLERDSQDQVYVGADLSLHRRDSPSKFNKTNLSRAMNSSSLVNMSRLNLTTPIGKAVCVGETRSFIGAGNRMLTRPHTANAAHMKKYTGKYSDWGDDPPERYMGPLDGHWNTTGLTTHTMYTGPVKNKPASFSKGK